MTRDELGAAADRLFRGSLGRLAYALGMNRDRFKRMAQGREAIPERLGEDVALLSTAAMRINAGLGVVAQAEEARGTPPNAVTAVVAEWADRRKQDG